MPPKTPEVNLLRVDNKGESPILFIIRNKLDAQRGKERQRKEIRGDCEWRAAD